LYDESIYWLAASGSDYSALEKLDKVDLNIETFRKSGSTMEFEITNIGSVPAVFVRFRITDPRTGESVLPAIFEDNYLTLMPGETRFIKADLSLAPFEIVDGPLAVVWYGLNVNESSKLF
jgi:hypothetical protein